MDVKKITNPNNPQKPTPEAELISRKEAIRRSGYYIFTAATMLAVLTPKKTVATSGTTDAPQRINEWEQ